MNSDKLDNFIVAFRGGISSCRMTCACGKEFFDIEGDWDWEDGELDELHADPNATPVNGSVSEIEINHNTYVTDCNCWHDKAEKMVNFMDSQAIRIRDYFAAEKRRLLRAAEECPVIELPEEVSPPEHAYKEGDLVTVVTHIHEPATEESPGGLCASPGERLIVRRIGGVSFPISLSHENRTDGATFGVKYHEIKRLPS
jgi:hypothetical protein